MSLATTHVRALPACITYYYYYINYTAVVQPVISSTIVGNTGTPQFTINTDFFKDDYGRVGVYKVVVVRGNRVEPSTIPDSQLVPVAVSPFK